MNAYHGENEKYFDIRLKSNFKIFISGPSRCGKTLFVKEFIQNLDIFTIEPPKIITLVYKVFQPIYYEMAIDHLIHDGENLKERLFALSNGESMLIIFDDMINSPSLRDLSDLFVVDGQHMNLSLVFLSQKLFTNRDEFRQISQNCDYYIVFKNPRNAQEIRNFSSQMTPGKMDLISYYTKATENPFSYLFINLTQECERQVKFLSHLFNEVHKMKTYFDGTSHHLIDGANSGRSKYNKMYIQTHPSTFKPTLRDERNICTTVKKSDENISLAEVVTDTSKNDEVIREIEKSVDNDMISMKNDGVMSMKNDGEDLGILKMDKDNDDIHVKNPPILRRLRQMTKPTNYHIYKGLLSTHRILPSDEIITYQAYS